ncbi:hypothetical protein A8B82_15765 [Sulfitobacter sp. EhC04]|uniref:type II secretion system protein GspL n=1 Tax=Sulfitobacter sp. EhC04 TaxID=1849168 RepID=UPI0007F3A99F|nr:type II secretion system protein GspL [Sulfitobacter sp. EhC04]OAN75967.1 hypothetical protein A8B82_15765 [Sulfitobacter sp. EhC04]
MTEAATYDAGKDFVALTSDGTAPGAQQVAVVNGADVPVFTLELPPGLRGQAREQVARRQLQDRAGLTAETTEIRPIYPPKQSEKWSKVLIADSALLAEWKATAGPHCRAVLPDYLTLPTASGIWSMAMRNDMLMVRLGPDEGFTAQPDLAMTMLKMQLDQADTVRPGAILSLGTAPEGLKALADAHNVPVITSPTEAKALGLEVPAVLTHGEIEFDLRRDPQMARTKLRKQVLPWRWPLLFALIAAGLWSAAQIIETRRIEARTAQLNTQTRELVREKFIPTGPLLDMRIQVSQVLAERQLRAAGWQSEITALDLFATAAGVLSTRGVETDQVSTVSGNEVALDLTMPDFASVDQLADDLRAAGLTVSVVQSRVSEGSAAVRSEIRLRAPETEAAE